MTATGPNQNAPIPVTAAVAATMARAWLQAIGSLRMTS